MNALSLYVQLGGLFNGIFGIFTYYTHMSHMQYDMIYTYHI